MGCCGNTRVGPVVSNLVKIREVRPGRYLAIHHFQASEYGNVHNTKSTESTNLTLQSHIANGKHSIQNEDEKFRTSAGDRPKTNRSFLPQGVIFFFHGVGGCSLVWRHQSNFFSSKGYDVVIVDLLGHGESPVSDKILNYRFMELARDALDVFNAFAISNKNIIVGHSYGTSLATVVAHENPNLVHRLVLISGGSPDPLAPQPGLFSLPMCCLSCLHPCIRLGFENNAFYSKSGASAMDKFYSFAVSVGVLHAMMWGQVWDEGGSEYHSTVHTPTLLIYGEHDSLVTLDEESEMLATLPNCWLRIVEASGHMVMLENPNKVNQLMLDFIETREVNFNLPPALPPKSIANGNGQVSRNPSCSGGIVTDTRNSNNDYPPGTTTAVSSGTTEHVQVEQPKRGVHINPAFLFDNSQQHDNEGQAQFGSSCSRWSRRSLPEVSPRVSNVDSNADITSPPRRHRVRRGVSSAGTHRTTKTIPRLL